MFENPLAQVGVALAAVLLIKEVFGFIRWWKDRDEKEALEHAMAGTAGGQGNYSGGGKSCETLKAEMRHAVREAMTPIASSQTDMLREIKNTNTQLIEKVTEMCSGIEELVDMNRRERVAKKS